MADIPTNPGEGPFRCPHCGAEYEISIKKIPVRDKDDKSCDVCRETMFFTNGSHLHSARLIK